MRCGRSRLSLESMLMLSCFVVRLTAADFLSGQWNAACVALAMDMLAARAGQPPILKPIEVLPDQIANHPHPPSRPSAFAAEFQARKCWRRLLGRSCFVLRGRDPPASSRPADRR